MCNTVFFYLCEERREEHDRTIRDYEYNYIILTENGKLYNYNSFTLNDRTKLKEYKLLHTDLGEIDQVAISPS